MASTHSLNTPSRSTIRSCVNSRPSTWTFQYIHCVGRMTTFLRAASSDLRMVSASLSEINFSSSSFFSFGSMLRRINGGEVIPHLFPHEHAVRADVNDAALFEQAGDQFLDLRINQRFAAANGNHRRIAFHGRLQAFFQRHHVLEDVEYSRMRPQPVQVRLQVCSGSSCKTIANFGVLRSLCLMMWLAIFFVSANGNRIIYFTVSQLRWRLSETQPGAFVGGGSGLQKVPRPRQEKIQRAKRCRWR